MNPGNNKGKGTPSTQNRHVNQAAPDGTQTAASQYSLVNGLALKAQLNSQCSAELQPQISSEEQPFFSSQSPLHAKSVYSPQKRIFRKTAGFNHKKSWLF